jgi:hypothetical protein
VEQGKSELGINFASHPIRNSNVVERFFVRVNVTEEFVFLATKLSIYYER